MEEDINRAVDEHSIADVNKINEAIVREALKQLKTGENDAVFDLQADCLTSGPDILVTHLTNMLRAYVGHGVVPCFILVRTFLSLVKDNLDDITSSDNYRAIASGSLLDIVILLIEGDKLDSDQLQFGFQANSSTSMCSWVATAVIQQKQKDSLWMCNRPKQGL